MVTVWRGRCWVSLATLKMSKDAKSSSCKLECQCHVVFGLRPEGSSVTEKSMLDSAWSHGRTLISSSISCFSSDSLLASVSGLHQRTTWAGMIFSCSENREAGSSAG